MASTSQRAATGALLTLLATACAPEQAEGTGNPLVGANLAKVNHIPIAHVGSSIWDSVNPSGSAKDALNYEYAVERASSAQYRAAGFLSENFVADNNDRVVDRYVSGRFDTSSPEYDSLREIVVAVFPDGLPQSELNLSDAQRAVLAAEGAGRTLVCLGVLPSVEGPFLAQDAKSILEKEAGFREEFPGYQYNAELVARNPRLIGFVEGERQDALGRKIASLLDNQPQSRQRIFVLFGANDELEDNVQVLGVSFSKVSLEK